MSDYVIRSMTPEQVQTAVDWAAREGWGPGFQDASCFTATDPEGFKAGFLDGRMISSISGVNYDDSFAFMGFYIADPDYRGVGYGYELAKAALAHCGDRNKGLDGVVEQQENYKRYGFKLIYRNIRFAGTVAQALEALPSPPETGITHLRQPSEALKTYDRALFPAPRDVFLTSWLGAPGHISRMAQDQDGITGYATLRPCHGGFKIGPLFADDPEIARALLAALLAEVPDDQRGETVYLDLPEPNAEALKLAAQLGFTQVFETARMYSDHAPDIDLNRIYGITSYELG
ncbi:GNAT family N-acetyltransferase [Ruegeria jejuensis]|uniref:GNAT family N-acetyltransferase n=1 Tax=Ruegeria jejuensis TaxID=3233338 RepID=UPI00355B4429